MAKKVWIDCDTGTDDSIAIMVAEALDELEIVGLSTVCGNTTQENAFWNTCKICGLMKRRHPVYRGAEKPLARPLRVATKFHGENGLGDVSLPIPDWAEVPEKPAWDAIYDCAKENGGDLHLVATGPLTNIATMLAKHGDATDYIKEIYIMGGSATFGNVTPAAEFNIWADPEAAAMVFRADWHVVMFGLNATLQAEYRPEDWDELAAFGTPACVYAKNCVQVSWKNLQKMGKGGVAQHDSCPVIFLAHPEFFDGKEAGVVVETRSSVSDGKTVTDVFSDVPFKFKNALVMLSVDRDRFIECLKNCIKKIDGIAQK